jgi:hypothetical protein
MMYRYGSGMIKVLEGEEIRGCFRSPDLFSPRERRPVFQDPDWASESASRALSTIFWEAVIFGFMVPYSFVSKDT